MSVSDQREEPMEDNRIIEVSRCIFHTSRGGKCVIESTSMAGRQCGIK